MAKPSIWNFLRDPESQRSVGNGLLDAANRGMVANSLGSLVDLSTNVANLGIAGAGYIGHKTGLLSQPPELIDSRNVPGSSEWIGQKMQNAGMVSPNRNALAELGMGLLSPVAYKGAQKMGGLLYNAESNALANLAKPSTMAMKGQRGVARVSGEEMIPQELKAYAELGAKHRAIMERDGIGQDELLYSIPKSELDKISFGYSVPDNPIAAAFYNAALKGAKIPSKASGWRYGSAPKSGVSWNHVDQFAEPGVSMASVDGLDYKWQPMQATGNPTKYSGYLLDYDKFWGSDGEPLMVGLQPIK